MDTRTYGELAELFERARSLPREQRDAWVQDVTADNPELRAALQGLLTHDSVADHETFLERGVREVVARAGSLGMAPAQIPAQFPTIAGFEVLRIVGHGSSGVVYEARQHSPERRVALKLLFSERTLGGARRRFDIEANALARMSHPCIARIFSTGSVQVEGVDRPYLALEFIEGRNLIDYAREHALDTPQRCELLARVADAVHDAHRHGVIHRDLKASNVLVDADGSPHVLDFGVARLAGVRRPGTTLHTRNGQILGTVTTMSPEQASGELEKLDRRTDVYSLGCILYELLCGVAALDLENCALHEAVRRIREVVPPKLGTHHASLRGDLEAIVATALEKEPSERYDTAAQLAADLRAFVADEPIRARAPTRWQELRRRFRRDRRARVGAAAGAAFLFGGIAVAAVFAARESLRAKDEQGRERARAGELYAVRAQRAYDAVVDGMQPQILQRFEALAADGEPWEYGLLRAAALNAQPFVKLGREAWRIREYGPPGSFLVSSLDGRLHCFDEQAPGALRELPTIGDPRYVDTSADGRRLAILSMPSGGTTCHVYLFEGDRLVREQVVDKPDRGWAALRFAPDGSRFAWALPDGVLHVWDGASGEEQRTVNALDGNPRAIDFSPSSRRILVAGHSSDARMHVVDATTGNIERTWAGGPAALAQAEFVDDDGSCVTLCSEGVLRRWVQGRDQPAAVHDTGSKQAQFSVDLGAGSIYVAMADGRLQCFGTRDLRVRWSATPDARRSHVSALSDDRRTLAVANAWGGIELIDTRGGLHVGTLAGPPGNVYEVRFVDRDRKLVWTANTGTVQRSSVGASHFGVLHGAESYLYDVAFLDDGELIATLDYDANLVVWSTSTRESLASVDLGGRGAHVAVEPSSARLFAALTPDQLVCLDARTLAELWRVPVPAWAMSCGGLFVDGPRARILAVGREGCVQSLSIADGSLLAEWSQGAAGLQSIAGIPGAETFVTATADTIRIHDAATLQEQRRVQVGGKIQRLGLDPRGERLAIGRVDGTCLVLDVREARVLHTLQLGGDGGNNPVYALAFDPSGARLVTGSRDGHVVLWDPVSGRRVLQLDAHAPAVAVSNAYYYVHALAFSKSGAQLVSASGDKTLRIWSNRTWQEQEAMLARAQEQRAPLARQIRADLDAGVAPAQLAEQFGTSSELDAEQRGWAIAELLRALHPQDPLVR